MVELLKEKQWSSLLQRVLAKEQLAKQP